MYKPAIRLIFYICIYTRKVFEISITKFRVEFTAALLSFANFIFIKKEIFGVLLIKINKTI